MLISVATATFYHLPFERALEIIAQSGFRYIELDLFWEWKNWAVAQHLRGIPPSEVVRAIHQAGLTVASLHDAGGVLERPDSSCGLVNPQVFEYLDQLGYAPDCLVFHAPHIEGVLDQSWWQGISGRVMAAFDPLRAACDTITLENEPEFDGFTVPLAQPEALLDFVCRANLGITMDTMHYAYMGLDIRRTASMLSGKVNTVHLSDYLNGGEHVFIGDGNLDFQAFFAALDYSVLHAITLECSPARHGEKIAPTDIPTYVDRMTAARTLLERWLKSMKDGPS